MSARQLNTLLVAVALVCGCSNSATLKLRNGRMIQSKILRSDAETVWVYVTEPWQVGEAVGRHVVVKFNDDETIVGTLLPDVLVPDYYSGSGYRRVTCILRDGDAAGRPFCATSSYFVVTEMAVRRIDIADVSHPGKVAKITGGLLLVAAGILAVAGSRAGPSSGDCGGYYGEGSGEPCHNPKWDAYAGAVIAAVTGLSIEIDGLITHAGSRSRYAPPETAPPPGPPQWWQAPPTKGAKGVRLGFEF